MSSVDLSWGFERLGSSATGESPGQHAFQPDVDTLVRESIQNSIDATLDGESTHVRIKHVTFTGSLMHNILSDISFETLIDNLEGTIREENCKETGLSNQLTKALNAITSDGKLEIVLIEDFNTKGLNGKDSSEVPINERGSYNALVRDNAISAKGEGSAGSKGVGKAMYWVFSGLSTVLFVSNFPEEDQDELRVSGSSWLPSHTSETDGACQGRGWFGETDPEDPRQRKYAAGVKASQIAESLGCYRTQGKSGTSIAIVGFMHPTESDYSAEQFREDVSRSVQKNFFPLLCRADLEVFFSAELNGEDVIPLTKIDLQPETLYGHLGRMYDLYLNGDPSVVAGAPQEDCQIGHTEIKLKVPAKEDGSTEPVEARATLLVSKKTISEGNDAGGKLFGFRGARMVVIGVNDKEICAKREDCHALLLTGQAQKEDGSRTLEDLSSENFLKDAEDASHTVWSGKSEVVRRKYKGRHGELLKRFVADAVKKAGELLTDPAEAGGQPPKYLTRLLKDINLAGNGPKQRTVSVTTRTNENLPEGSSICVLVRPKYVSLNSDWSFSVSTQFPYGASTRKVNCIVDQPVCNPPCNVQDLGNGVWRVDVDSSIREVEVSVSTSRDLHPQKSTDVEFVFDLIGG